MLKFVKIKIGLEFNKTINFISTMLADAEYNKIIKKKNNKILKNDQLEDKEGGMSVISSEDKVLSRLKEGECIVVRCGKCGSNIGFAVIANVISDVMSGITKEIDVDKDEWDCPGCYTVLEFPNNNMMSIVSPYERHDLLKDLQDVQEEVEGEINASYSNQIGRPKYITYLACKSPSRSKLGDPYFDGCCFD